MKKRLFSLFMAVCMVLSVLPFSVFATETEHVHSADCGHVSEPGSDGSSGTPTPTGAEDDVSGDERTAASQGKNGSDDERRGQAPRPTG